MKDAVRKTKEDNPSSLLIDLSNNTHNSIWSNFSNHAGMISVEEFISTVRAEDEQCC